MKYQLPHSAPLVCHPRTPTDLVQGMQVSVFEARSGMLAVTFIVEGDMTRLCIQPLGPSRRADRLWEHTCFEAFVAVRGLPSYYEFNFSPSGEWTAYAFRGYRDSMPLELEEMNPEIAVRRADNKLELDATLRLHRLPMTEPRTRLRLALSAVIEDQNGALSYWALKHPTGKPDFHHPDAFALEFDSTKTQDTVDLEGL
jgi:hypothetical protein